MKRVFAGIFAFLIALTVFPVFALADGTATLTVEIDGDFSQKTYPIGTQITLDPGEDPAGFVFAYWENKADSSVFSTERNYTFTLKKDTDLRAEYDSNFVEAGNAVWDYSTGVPVFGPAPAGVSYDATTHTLLLNNAVVRASTDTDGVILSAISSTGPLTIEISGNNTVSGPVFGIEMVNGSKLTITGSGTLTCYAERIDEQYGTYAFGVLAGQGNPCPKAIIPQIVGSASGYLGKNQSEAEENGAVDATRFQKEFDEAGTTNVVWSRLELKSPMDGGEEPVPETGDGMGPFVFAGLALVSALGMVMLKKRERN